MKVNRPVLLYVLTFLFLLAGLFSLIGTLGIFKSWGWWLSFVSVKSIIFQVFFGVLTTLAWSSAAVILWLRLSWAVYYCSGVTILAVFWFWVERIFLTQNPMTFNRHALVLAIMCVFLIFVFSSLYLVAPSMKPYHSSCKDGGDTSVQPKGENNE